MFPTNPSNRLTYPTGTKIPDPFRQVNPFSNPSTAANGALGAGAGANNVPQIGAQVGTEQANSNSNSFGDWLKNLFKVNKPQGAVYVPPGIGNPQNNPALPPPVPFYRNPYTGFANVPSSSQPTNAFSSPTPPSSTVSNPSVGYDLGSSPASIPENVAGSMLQGYSFQEMSQYLGSQGYSYIAPSQANNFQGSWLKTGSPTQNGLADKYGAYFDPGTLNRYEKVKGANGNIYRGGETVTKDLSTGVNGTPAGTGQYSVTLQQNINKKLEAHGAYKWQSTLSRDANGNWVRTYKKVLKGYKTREGRQRMENNAARNANQNDQGLQKNFNQLVTLRANYG